MERRDTPATLFQSTIVKNQTITRSTLLPRTRDIHFVNCVFPTGYKLFQGADYYRVIFTKCVVHNCTTRMFAECEHLKSIDLLGLDTSDVFDMSGMFSLCLNLLEVVGSTCLKTSQVEDMSEMFNRCESLKCLNLSGFDVSKVTTMHRMFYNCKRLEHLNLSKWKLNPDVDITQAFDSCDILSNMKADDEKLASIANDIRTAIIERRTAAKKAEEELIRSLFE